MPLCLIFVALQDMAFKAIPFVEAMATHRANGLDAWVRTVAICAASRTVAYSMLGTQ